MTPLEKVLQECLRDLEEGTSTVEECLSRHPEYAAQLRPILLASTYLVGAREVQVSAEFKARVRAKVMQEVRAHPRRPVRSASMFMRLSIGLMAIALTLLATGTAYAQGTLPGSAFYSWKLASEDAWRAVSFDPVGTDLEIAARRADELIAVSGNRALYPQALKTYLETADRLKSEANEDNKARILSMLDSQVRRLSRSGITLPLSGKEVVPLSVPTATPLPTPLLTSPTPQPSSTPLSRATSTAPAPTQAPSTSDAPPKIVPTLHSPPAIAPTTNSQIP